MSLRSCCCLQSIGEDALGHPGVARIPDETRDAAALHGRDLALLMPAQFAARALQLSQEMLGKFLVPIHPVRDAESVAETIQAQRVHTFDDPFRVAQVPAHPSVDVRARLDPTREFLFAGTLEIAQSCRREWLATSNAARLNASLRV